MGDFRVKRDKNLSHQLKKQPSLFMNRTTIAFKQTLGTFLKLCFN